MHNSSLMNHTCSSYSLVICAQTSLEEILTGFCCLNFNAAQFYKDNWKTFHLLNPLAISEAWAKKIHLDWHDGRVPWRSAGAELHGSVGQWSPRHMFNNWDDSEPFLWPDRVELTDFFLPTHTSTIKLCAALSQNSKVICTLLTRKHIKVHF